MTVIRSSFVVRTRALAFAAGMAAMTIGCGDDGGSKGTGDAGGVAVAPDGGTGGGGTDGGGTGGGGTGGGGTDAGISGAPAQRNVDTAFGAAGRTIAPLSAAEGDRFQAVVVGADGKSYAAGFTTATGDQAFAVARLGTDGKLDTGFGTNGVASLNVATGGKTAELARGVVVQSTGKVVVAGPVEHDPAAAGLAAGDTDVAVVRFDATGKPDTTFGTNGVVRLDLGTAMVATNAMGMMTLNGGDTSWGLGLLPGDKLVIVASTLPMGRTDTDFAIVQLNADGTRDMSFGTNGVAMIDVNMGADNPRQVFVGKDGKLVISGYTRDSANVISLVLFRLAANGTLDATFGAQGIVNPKILNNVSEAYDVAPHADGLVITGYGKNEAGEKVDMIAARFKADGALDTAFGMNGLVQVDLAGQDDRGRDLVVLSDNRILIVGSGKPNMTDQKAMAVMLKADGKLDTTFGDAGKLIVDLGGPMDSFFGVATTSDNKAVVVGWKGGMAATADDAAAVRLLP